MQDLSQYIRIIAAKDILQVFGFYGKHISCYPFVIDCVYFI